MERTNNTHPVVQQHVVSCLMLPLPPPIDDGMSTWSLLTGSVVGRRAAVCTHVDLGWFGSGLVWRFLCFVMLGVHFLDF